MTFYEKVLEEYSQGCEKFICEGSKTFENKWKYKTNRLKIARKAKKFLRISDKLGYIRTERQIELGAKGALFVSIGRSLGRKIRLDFIKWCIKNKLDL